MLDAEEISAFLLEVFPGAMDHFAIEEIGDPAAVAHASVTYAIPSSHRPT